MAYKGSIDLISGVRPKGGADFPVADAKDIYVSDNERLDVALTRLDNKLVIITQEEYEAGAYTAPEGAVVIVVEAVEE